MHKTMSGIIRIASINKCYLRYQFFPDRQMFGASSQALYMQWYSSAASEDRKLPFEI